MNCRSLFRASAIIEALTGGALLITPSLVIELLLGDGLSATGIAVARILGVSLLSIGVATWESPHKAAHFAPRAGLCIYNVGAATLLLLFGVQSELNGVLLWPAAGLHGLIGITMLWAIFVTPQTVKD